MKLSIRDLKSKIYDLSAQAYFYKVEMEKYKKLYVEEMNFRMLLSNELNM